MAEHTIETSSSLTRYYLFYYVLLRHIYFVPQCTMLSSILSPSLRHLLKEARLSPDCSVARLRPQKSQLESQTPQSLKHARLPISTTSLTLASLGVTSSLHSFLHLVLHLPPLSSASFSTQPSIASSKVGKPIRLS